jgi:hypothetical protein
MLKVPTKIGLLLHQRAAAKSKTAAAKEVKVALVTVAE